MVGWALAGTRVSGPAGRGEKPGETGMEILLWVLVIALGAANLVLLLTRTGGSDDRAEKAVREELRVGRAESADASKASMEITLL